jgi:hypothetical protein
MNKDDVILIIIVTLAGVLISVASIAIYASVN